MDEEEDDRPTMGESSFVVISSSHVRLPLASVRKPADEEQDIDIDSYRENYGSGLKNTRISDRENEVV